MDIVVLPGDGIGPEITGATVAALNALEQRFSLGLNLHEEEIGLSLFAREGTTLPEAVFDKAANADGIVLGPVSASEYPPAADGGINPITRCRIDLELYANVRPCRTRAGVPSAVKSMDLIIVRENTEGFYVNRNMAQGIGEFMPTDEVALAIGKTTRTGSRRIALAALRLAQRRRRKLAYVHKAGILRLYGGLFVEEVEKAAQEFPEIELESVSVDAMAALLVREPERFDVIVTTNMYGDILSDEAAELAGGLGLAASVNHGDTHAIAQAAHGSAPDIAGKDVANPTGLLQSVAMLLDHLGAKAERNDLAEAATCLMQATDSLLASPDTRTRDLGGSLGTKAFGTAVAERILAGG